MVACYPRTMSAWLSNLLTVPHVSLYAHDALHDSEVMEVLHSLDHPYIGVVDTGASKDMLPQGAEVTVIDADTDKVRQRLESMLGGDWSREIGILHENMETLKENATVYHVEAMDDWISEFFQHHTGLPFDMGRYAALRGLNVQSRLVKES